jgi:hypothetical protein
MQRIEIDGYLESAKADLGNGVITLLVKVKQSEIPNGDLEQLAEFGRNELILALEISPYGKDKTAEADGRLDGVRGDYVSDTLSLTFKVMRNEIDKETEKLLEQTTALHIRTLIACSARQKSFFEGTKFEHAKVELKTFSGG